MTQDTDTGTRLHSVPPSRAAAIAEFIRYWHDRRDGLDVPRRSDIDPRGIEQLLPNAFIAERIAPGLARMRIAGSHLADLMGMEVRGMPLSAFIAPAHRDALSHHLVRLFDQPALLRLSLSAPARAGAPELCGEMHILPLRSDLGDISRALGCLVTQGTLGRGPRRFEIADVQITALDGTPQSSGIHPRPSPRQGGTLHRPAIKHEAERPYLRLVKT